MTPAIEVKYLLRFFAQSQEEQWAQIPQSLSPVWVDTGHVDAPTDKPLKVLGLILYSHLNGAPSEFEKAYDILDDLRAVLDWMTELGSDEILGVFDSTDAEAFESNSYNNIWKVVRRLCRLALACPCVQQCEGAELSLGYFLETYTFPISQEEFQQWTHRR
jgi:hypothetical protein